MIWLPGEPTPEARGRWTETTQSFTMSMQCDHFDPRLKFKKVDFFQSQKVSCRESEVEAKSEAAYDFCKRTVLRRYNALAAAITAQRNAHTPFPIEAPQPPNPVSRTNARAFEQFQERKQVAARSAPASGLRPPSNDAILPWVEQWSEGSTVKQPEGKILGENYIQ